MKTHLSKLLKIRGFTLIEMLVVIAIIGLLTGIVMTSLTGSKAKARDAKRISDIGNIQLALELYFDRCKVYPNSITGTGAKNGLNNADCPNGITLANFISVIPTAPNSGTYDYAVLKENTSNNVTDYVLHIKLESYNEVMKDALPVSTYPPTSQPTGSTWSGSSFSCTNVVNTTEYCRGSK